MKHLVNIRELEVGTICELKNICPLVTLTTLHMNEPDLQELGCLHTLKCLTDLDIHSGKGISSISEKDIRWLRSVPLKKLKFHRVSGTTDMIARVIGSIESLLDLELSQVSDYSVKISNEGIKHLCGLKLLRKVNFYGCKRVGDEGIMQMASTLKFLKNINVRQTGVSEECALVLRRQFKLNVVSNSSWLW